MGFLEKQRRLQSVVLTGVGPLSRDIPKDTVIKRIGLRMQGAIQTTFASGTPVARADSIFHSLINSIQVVANGGRFIKNVQPHLVRMQALLNTSVQGERGSVAAAAPQLTKVQVDSGFVYGTTTQYTTLNETLTLPFEFIWSKAESERMLTWFDTRDLSSAEIRFQQNPYSSLLSQANTAPVTFSNSTIQIDITLVEAVGVPKGQKFFDFRQTTKDIPFTGQATNYQIEINRNNALAGLLFYAKDGAAGSTSTATDRLASNSLATDMTLKLNGNIDLKATTFLDLQAENRARYGVVAPFSGSVSQLDGIAHMNFINNSISDAVNTKTGVDSLYLFVSTNSASNVSYTNTAFLTIQTDEIAEISQ